MKRTRWQPDTCGCVFVYEWDPAVAAASRAHLPVEFTPCSEHTGMSADVAFSTIVAENQMKNRVIEHAINSDDFGEDAVDPEGQPVRRFRWLKRLQWGFDRQRRLHVVVPNAVTDQELNRLQNLANQHYPGKIIVRRP